MDWIKKNKDWLITLAVFASFGIILLVTSIIFQGNGDDHPTEPVIEEEVTFTPPSEQQGTGTGGNQSSETQQTTSFFLNPSPTELLTKLEGLSQQEFRNETKNLPGLRIMWPGYFFSIMKVEKEKAHVMLDASEDGFGVVLLTEIDIVQYPEILEKKPGEKIWMAAEITGVDPTGTGAFILKTEYVRFDDYQPKISSPLPGDQETGESKNNQ